MSDPQQHRTQRQDNLRPEPENQARAGSSGSPDHEGLTESEAGHDRDTGTGTGGATESAGRVDNHEGVHLGNQPNS